MRKLISLMWAAILVLSLTSAFSFSAGADDLANEEFSFTVSGTNNYDYAYDVLSQLNELRTSKGLSSVKMDKELLAIAMQRAAELSVYYSHVRPNGTSCFSLATDNGSHAENIAVRYATPDEVMEAWTNSSGHYKNMTGSAYKSVGIGCFETSDGTLCWVQFFSSKSPTKITKSGEVKTAHTVTALYKYTNMKLQTDGYVTASAELGDKFNVILENTNRGFSYVTQEIELSDFELSSSDPDVITVDKDGVCTVQGVGEVIITADSATNSNISFAFEEEIGQVHTYTNYVYNDNATCAKNGTKTAKCDCGCGRTKTVTVYGTKLEHKWGKWKTAKEPTCTEKGTRMRECENCTYWQKYALAATGHVSDGGKQTRAPSYSQSGIITYTCEVCDEVIQTETIARITLGKVKNLKASSATTTTVTLTWNKVEGARKYRVYRYVNGKWKRIKTTSKTSYTVEELKSGTTYKFRVRAIIDSDIKGAYSSVLETSTKPKTPKLTLKSATGQITASWKTVNGASGYQIKYSTGKSMKNAKTVTVESNVIKLRVKKLKSGKRYYFKIRAYKIVDGKKVYSSWSSVKSVKVK